ncbi:MAG: EAL domain-containing protein [Proteobacteria bacterium]|nr:EAL domain-containing protein [Pseudomonadota bacterium]
MHSPPDHPANEPHTPSIRPRTLGAIVFVAAALIATFFVVESERARQSHERLLVTGLVTNRAHHLEGYISQGLSASYALAALVEVGQGEVPDFERVAAQLLPHYPGASEFALAPNGVVRQIVPLAGNEKALGLDVLSSPSQKAEAALTRATGQLTVAGPLDLVQGGQGLIGRLPVFLGEAAGGRRFWGFSEVVMRLPGALQPAQLSELSAVGYRYALWRKNPDSGALQIIESSPGVPVDPIEVDVRLPNGVWTLSVAPDHGWIDPFAVARKAAVGLIVAFLSAYLANLLLAQKARGNELEQLVTQRSADIKLTKDRLKALLDAIPDPVWLKDTHGVYLSCNPQFERYFGAAEADIVGHTDYEFVERQLAESFRENDRKAMETGQPCANERWLTFARDGYRGLFETIKAPMRSADGVVTGVVGIARDVTARYRARKAARLTQVRLRVALQATRIAIWDWDIKHDRWYASREYYTALGYRPEVEAGDRDVWMERVHPEDRARVLATVEGARSAVSQLYEYEARIRGADGSYRWMSVRGKAVERDSDGRATRMLGVRIDVTDKKRAEEHIEHLAHYDTLTGLPNRVLLSERIAASVALARSRQGQLALLVLDIDKLKNINDTFGQTIGDELLVEVGRRVRSLAADDDSVGRVDSDTFVMMVAGAKTTQASRKAQRLLDALSTPFRIRGLELMVTAAIGIALFPAHGADFEALLKCANTAMHRAKHNGRNQYVFFAEDMQARSTRNQQLEIALRHAIERGELQLHYQPQVSLADGRLTGAEALLRWNHPELGRVSPAEFIPIIEDSGQIVQIGTWVLRTAATQLSQWRAAGLLPFSMAVNLSSAQFRHPNLAGLMGKILHETGLEAGSLYLELTERVAMDDPLGAIAIMSELHELGVRIAIDDFGTGYSSLSYLKRFRAHKLKIDQSFVRDLAQDPDDQAIVKAIINLAASLGIETIAEGVETLPQRDFLRQHGCQEAQGFYFSQPLPAEQFTAFLRDAGHFEAVSSSTRMGT